MSERAINVLLIEGDADESSVIKRSLAAGAEADGTFEVKEAPRLSTGSRLLAQERFDAVLLDLSLAQSVGIEGFRKVRAQAPEVPILILAALSDEAIAAEAVREGAQDYVIKGTPDCLLLKRAIRHAIERKRLSREVERLLEGDPVAQIVLDGAARTLYANPSAEALFGVKAESLLGRPFEHPLSPEAPSQIKLGAPGAEERAVELSVRGIAWSGGEARLLTLRDVTETGRLRRLEADVLENMRIVEIKNQFMGRISHELRNTLATVKTAVFCLKDGLGGSLSQRQSRLVDMISRNVDRQVRIIDNILDLARFQSGKIKIAPRPVELAQVIDEIAQEFRLKNKAHRFLLELPDELPVVNGDPDLLVQVLRNLLDNAFRFARSRVTVRAGDGGRAEVLLSVIDDGSGIPKERIGELFNQFVQLDRPGGSGYKGTGLGLAICKEIVDGHGGRIWAESAEGEGTSFHLVLPKCGKAGVHEPAFSAGQGQARPSHGVQK